MCLPPHVLKVITSSPVIITYTCVYIYIIYLNSFCVPLLYMCLGLTLGTGPIRRCLSLEKTHFPSLPSHQLSAVLHLGWGLVSASVLMLTGWRCHYAGLVWATIQLRFPGWRLVLVMSRRHYPTANILILWPLCLSAPSSVMFPRP